MRSDPPSDFDQALAAHQAGDLDRAEAGYRLQLARDAGHADAAHLLGVIAHQRGRSAEAVALIEGALSLRADANFANSLGEARRAMGDIAGAVAAYDRALGLAPDHAVARANRGLARLQVGDAAAALADLAAGRQALPGWAALADHLNQALAGLGQDMAAAAAIEAALGERPADPVLQLASARVLHALDRPMPALVRVEAAIRLGANRADAHFLNGVLLRRADRIVEATHAYARAVEREPTHADALMNWGNILSDAGALDQAHACYAKAVEAAPTSGALLTNLTNLLMRMERVHDAVAVGLRAVAVAPDLPEAHLNLGNAHHGLNQLEEAAARYRAALAMAPDRVDLRVNLASTLAALDLDDEAFALFDAVLAARPEMAELFVNRGKAWAERREVDRAEADYRRAVALAPDLAVAHANLGVTRLLRGDFATGWAEFEWRWRTPGFARLAAGMTRPEWRQGEAIAGRAILLHNEQGFGDTLQFCRLARAVRAMGATVLLQVQRPLARLFDGFADADLVIAEGDPLPDHDLRCPLLTVPGRLGIDLATIPADLPYLAAAPAAAEAWRRRLATKAPGLKVGLVWAASPENPVDRRRSPGLDPLTPLAAVPGVTFVALQKGAAAEAPVPAAFAGKWLAASPELHDFADTAAVIAGLDLVISVCSSPAHLAGAMGKPVWLLDRFDGDWRWLLDRYDSPWYPTMRIFRQPARGDWATPVAAVVGALARRVEGVS
jgi:tetratricopeptide (TPR) repeat protein